MTAAVDTASVDCTGRYLVVKMLRPAALSVALSEETEVGGEQADFEQADFTRMCFDEEEAFMVMSFVSVECRRVQAGARVAEEVTGALAGIESDGHLAAVVVLPTLTSLLSATSEVTTLDAEVKAKVDAYDWDPPPQVLPSANERAAAANRAAAKAVEQAEAEANAKAVAAAEVGGDWACDICTVVNAATSNTCECCAQGTNPHKKEETKPSYFVADDQWQCPVCTVVNDKAAEKCATCGVGEQAPLTAEGLAEVRNRFIRAFLIL